MEYIISAIWIGIELILLVIVMYTLHLNQIATGILLGIVMVAVTLTLAYIPKGEE